MKSTKEGSKPEISFPDTEYERLMELLDDAPRPAPFTLGFILRRRAKDFTRGREPIMQGPNGLELIWVDAGDGDPKHLASRYGLLSLPSNTFLALGSRSYFVTPQVDRVLVWRQLWKPPPGATIRLSLFDTRRLKPVGKRWSIMWRYEEWDPVIWKDGLVASTDVPLELEPGRHSKPFPEPMQSVKELLMIGFQFANQERPTKTSMFIARPENGTVEVVPLAWWDRKPGINRFIARIARDPQSRNIVGDGIGVKPFLIRPSGDLLGWIVRRPKNREPPREARPRARAPA